MDNKKIGTFIAIKRKQKGMTQKQLAEKLGVTNKAISKWETGEGYPDITTIPILAEVLNITTDELLSGKEKYDNSKHIKVENSEELAEYIINKDILRFKNYSFISQGIALFGIILDFIFWYEYHKEISILIYISLTTMSILIWTISYNILRKKTKKYNSFDPSSEMAIDKIAVNPLVISLWIWLIFPIRIIIFWFIKTNVKYIFYYRLLDKFGVFGLYVIIIIGYILVLSVLTFTIKKLLQKSADFRS